MDMAWFWFFIVVILLALEFRTALRAASLQRKTEALVNSLSAVIVESGLKPEDAASLFIDNLGSTLFVRDYDTFMKDLCVKNGLRYKLDDEGYIIDEDLKKELARRIGHGFIVSRDIVNAGK